MLRKLIIITVTCGLCGGPGKLPHSQPHLYHNIEEPLLAL